MKLLAILVLTAFGFFAYFQTASAFCCDACPLYKCTPNCNVFGCNCRCFVCVGEYNECKKREEAAEFARQKLASMGFFGKLAIAQNAWMFGGRKKRDAVEVGGILENMNETILVAKERFKKADKSSDGKITKQEAIEYLVSEANSLNSSIKAEDLNKQDGWWKTLDINGDGKIEPYEVDADLAWEDGGLTRDEAIGLFGFNQKLVDQMKNDNSWFGEVDKDGDGKIELEELKKIEAKQKSPKGGQNKN